MVSVGGDQAACSVASLTFLPLMLVFTRIAISTGMGSVSKYALSHSPVPIIVVRPERNVRKVQEKRLKDPKRGTHFNE